MFRVIDTKGMRERAREELHRARHLDAAGRHRAVENLSGGQRQAVAVARAAAFGSKVVVLDEPTAASACASRTRCSNSSKSLRDQGIPVILITHNMPQVFEVADRIHIQRLGKRAATITPQSRTR